MEYNNYSCPVCSEQFKNGDDVVVCPECGAPHHRDCYDSHGSCYFAHRHSEGFDYKTQNDDSGSQKNRADSNTCQYCGTENAKGSKYCSSCNMPLTFEESESQIPFNPFGTQTPPPGVTGPQQIPNTATFVLDPLGGVAPETDIGGGVTAGEAAKFVKSNTPFYTRLFYQLKVFGKSRFSFVGFFFTGIWMMYRKMYKLGALITALLFSTMFAYIFLSYGYQSFLTGAETKITELLYGSNTFATASGLSDVWGYFTSLTTEYQIVLGSYYLIAFLQFALRLTCGLCANRWYYKHCKKQITKIKNSADAKEISDTVLQTKGGVNTALVISLVVSYLAISYLPSMLFGG